MSWLYSVDTAVEAQTQAERTRAAREGLLVVLSRLTGLGSVPRSAEVSAALEQVDTLYDEFVFFERREDDITQRYLNVTFQSDAMLALVKSAGLPVWWSKRPQIIAWLVAESGGEREILGNDSAHPLVKTLHERARLRGLPIVIPLMDLDDSMAVSAADVWGKVGQTLDTAAQRYGADLVLIGRFSEQRSGELDENARYSGDWEIWLDGEPVVASFSRVDAHAVAVSAVDRVADRLAEKYAVLPRSRQRQQVAITGLNNAQSYAAMMSYLAGLEFIDRVDVTSIDATALKLTIDTRAERSQLIMLLTAEERLAVDKFYRGLDLRFAWQG